jgi:hypothetical protein
VATEVKHWTDYLEHASELIAKGYAEGDEVEIAKKLFLINKSREEDAGTSSPPKHNN